MLKLSVTLPNGVLVTLESDGTEPVHEVLAQVLSSVQTDAQPAGEVQFGAAVDVERVAEKSIGVPGYASAPRAEGPRESTNGLGLHPTRGPNPSVDYAPSGNGTVGVNHGESGDNTLDLDGYAPQAKQDFVAFCEAINPTGDMRRVVVATEAADRFFGLEGVTADEAGELFDLIGWRRANNFTQTIRNAARSKFGWLERIPGRSGRYAATEVGRSTTLSG